MKGLTVALVGATAAATVVFMLWDRLKKRVLITWREVGTLQDIYIYPIKSGKYISLSEGRCTTFGLMATTPGVFPLRDRFFVVYREDTKEFISARTYNKMVLIQVSPKSSKSVVLSYPETEDFELIVPVEGGTTKILLWGCEVKTTDCGDSIAKWISRVVSGKESGYRVGFWSPKITDRREVACENHEKLRNEDSGAYSDLSSFHLLCQASVDDLNKRIGEDSEFTPRNFRPNFVVQGSEPYAEDEWDWIRIGNDVIFRNVKLCTRCLLPTVDPQTGVRDPRQEPQKTLIKYRQLKDPKLRAASKNSPTMGINLGLYQEGVVRVGDRVFVG